LNQVVEDPFCEANEMTALSELNVLVVDSNSNTRMAARQMLQDIDVQNIFLATNEEAARANLNDDEIDLIILASELEAEELDDRIKTLSGESSRLRQPIILVSSQVSPEQIPIAKKLGVSSIVLKPFSSKAIEKHVNLVAKEIG